MHATQRNGIRCSSSVCFPTHRQWCHESHLSHAIQLSPTLFSSVVSPQPWQSITNRRRILGWASKRAVRVRDRDPSIMLAILSPRRVARSLAESGVRWTGLNASCGDRSIGWVGRWVGRWVDSFVTASSTFASSLTSAAGNLYFTMMMNGAVAAPPGPNLGFREWPPTPEPPSVSFRAVNMELECTGRLLCLAERAGRVCWPSPSALAPLSTRGLG